MKFYVILSLHDSDDSLSYIRSKCRTLDKAQFALDLTASDSADTDRFELYKIDLTAGTNNLIRSARGHLET